MYRAVLLAPAHRTAALVTSASLPSLPEVDAVAHCSAALATRCVGSAKGRQLCSYCGCGFFIACEFAACGCRFCITCRFCARCGGLLACSTTGSGGSRVVAVAAKEKHRERLQPATACSVSSATAGRPGTSSGPLAWRRAASGHWTTRRSGRPSALNSPSQPLLPAFTTPASTAAPASRLATSSSACPWP